MKHTDKTYQISEIFYSLQGEGYHTGIPAVFVRFAGCNMRCSFCDTDFSVKMTLTAKEIAEHCLSLYNKGEQRMLILTGGEPALQIDTPLIDLLHQAGYYICIETNGLLPLPEGIDWITCSPKQLHLTLARADELKVLYKGESVEEQYDLIPATYHYLQPCIPYTTNRQAADYILTHPHWRLSLQTHKILNIR